MTPGAETAPDTATSSGLTVAVVLAAGAGSRFVGPGHKLAAELDGVTVASRSIASAVDAAIGPVIVVTGAADVAVPARVQVVHHAGWADGQATSLQAGVRAADALGATAVVVGLADQPFVAPDAWRRVAADPAPIAVATYGGKRRNPVRLSREIWPLLPTHGDEGARAVMRVRPDLVSEVPCPGSPADIDTLEDLTAWQSRSSTNSP